MKWVMVVLFAPIVPIIIFVGLSEQAIAEALNFWSDKTERFWNRNPDYPEYD